MPLRALQDLLGEEGQWLALDPPTEADGATVGGLLATGESGPRRLRYGALRDLVIGVTLVLADGTVAHAGGHVIKNVAGYDLTKLLYGSLGTLGLIAEVVLRLHPRPETSATVVVPSSVQEATARASTAGRRRWNPSAIDWVGDPRAADRPADSPSASREPPPASRHRRRHCGSVWRGRAEPLAGTDEAAYWRSCRRPPGRAGPEHGVRRHAARRLTACRGARRRRRRRRGRLAGVPHRARAAHRPVSGPPAQQAAAFDRWRREVLAIGGTVAAPGPPGRGRRQIDPLGPAPSAVGLLRALKARLDPDGRCAPGRLGPWL